ncbi:MAG: ATP-binding protein, partial [Gemmatimonadales bacterium]|nr:ATP-binding protein [Gemmatimonadales bacterium]
MARADLLLDIVRAGARGDQTLFRKALEALVAEERAKQHHVLADRLASHLQQNGSSAHAQPSPVRRNGQASDLFFEVEPRRRLDDLILPDVVAEACRELVEEHNRADLLRAHNLEPRHRVLVAGPPGNGKTSLAEALASELAVSLLVVRYESVIASYLGETAVRLSRLFEQVRTQRCVLFFDEFDVVGKERGDIHETGEIKRVVSSLLLQVDALPSYVVVVTATNHPELLDRAVWRRF